MNTPIPKITIEQIAAIYPHVDKRDHWMLLEAENSLIDKANAQQETYITAEQARKLGTGNAEQLYTLDTVYCWRVCGVGFQYPTWRQGQAIKYRAIKQAQPEPVPFPRPYDPNLYCMVSAKGEPAARMLRTAAQELQRKLGDTVDWYLGVTNMSHWEELNFNGTDTYTYAPKALKQVSWSDMPVGVMTNEGEFQGCHMWGNKLQISVLKKTTHSERKQINSHDAADVKLAPASEQPWMYWGGGECPVPEGCTFEVTLRTATVGKDSTTQGWNWKNDKESGDIIAFKITGIAKGYVMEGAV